MTCWDSIICITNEWNTDLSCLVVNSHQSLTGYNLRCDFRYIIHEKVHGLASSGWLIFWQGYPSYLFEYSNFLGNLKCELLIKDQNSILIIHIISEKVYCCMFHIWMYIFIIESFFLWWLPLQYDNGIYILSSCIGNLILWYYRLSWILMYL